MFGRQQFDPDIEELFILLISYISEASRTGTPSLLPSTVYWEKNLQARDILQPTIFWVLTRKKVEGKRKALKMVQLMLQMLLKQHLFW
jgi:hypothetical protein